MERNQGITSADLFQIGMHLQYIGNCIPDSKLKEAGKHIEMIEDIILKYAEGRKEQEEK